jgi:hypothetical protein
MMTFALLAGATAPTSDQMGTALVMSRIMKQVALKISASINGAVNHSDLPILAVVFKLAVFFIVGTILLEGFRVAFKIVGSGGSFWANIAEPTLLKHLLRACICLFLGLGTWVIVVPADASGDVSMPIYKVPIFAASGTSGYADGGRASMQNLMDFLDPDKKVTQVGDALDQVAQKVSAYSVIQDVQETDMKIKAGAAAEAVWDEMQAAAGITKGDASYDGTPDPAALAAAKDALDKASHWYDSLLADVSMLGNIIAQMAVRIFYVIMYSALDLMIVRVLWANVIFMLIGYKIAFALIPTAIVLAYFESMRSTLVGVVKLVFIYAIAMTVIAECSTKLFASDTDGGPNDAIAQIVKNINDSNPETPDDDMKQYARTQFASWRAQQPSGNHDGFVEYVKAQAGTWSQQPFSAKSSIVAPVAVFMSLLLSITILGKMATIVHDAISGTMSYHN